MHNKELKNLNPLEHETIIDDGGAIFIITRYFIGSRSLDKVFEEILQKHDEINDKVS